MEKHCGGRDVRPTGIINHVTQLASAPLQVTNGDDGAEADQYLTGGSHREKRKRKAKQVTAGVQIMLDSLKEKWEEDKERKEMTRKEDLEITNRMLQTMEEYQKTIKTIGGALTVALNRLADRSSG